MNTEKIEQDPKLTQALLDFGEWSQKVLFLDNEIPRKNVLNKLSYIQSIWSLTDKFFSLVEKHGKKIFRDCN